MSNFTKMTIYKVNCWCCKLDRLVDEYPIGYFVSKEDALTGVLNDMETYGIDDYKVAKFTVTGFDKDSEYIYDYKLTKINVGADFRHDPLTEIGCWK